MVVGQQPKITHYRLAVGQLVTGKVMAILPAQTLHASRVLDGAGEITATLPLKDVSYRPLEFNGNEWLPSEDMTRLLAGLRGLLVPWKAFLAVLTDDNQIVEAGPLIDLPSYHLPSGELQLAGMGLWRYFDKRIIAQLAVNHGAVITFNAPTHYALASQIVRRTLDADTMIWDIPNRGKVPVVTGNTATSPATTTRSYNSWELKGVGEALHDLMATMEPSTGVGFNLQFRPEWKDAQHIQWRMVMASHNTQPGNDAHILDASAVQSLIHIPSLQVNGSDEINLAWGSGAEDKLYTPPSNYPEGANTEMAKVFSDHLDLDYPVLEKGLSFNSYSGAPLTNQVRSLLEANLYPWDTWKTSVEATDDMWAMQLGDWVRLRLPADPWIDEGEIATTITAMTGRLDSEIIEIELAPVAEGEMFGYRPTLSPAPFANLTAALKELQNRLLAVETRRY